MSQRIKNLSFVVFVVCLTGVIVQANTTGTTVAFKYVAWIPHFDKIGHFALMGALAFLALQVFVPRMKSGHQNGVRRIIVILLLFIGLEEGSQAFNPNRTFSIPDYLFSVAGVAVAVIVFSYWHTRNVRHAVKASSRTKE